MARLQLIDRGRGRVMALLPGWAADSRVFGRLDLPYDYLLVDAAPAETEAEILGWMKRQDMTHLSFLGWSLGAFLAVDFTRRHPQRVESVILTGARPRYSTEAIAGIRRELESDRRDCLRRFYHACFSDRESRARRWFKRELQPAWLEEMTTENLRNSLAWLETAALPADGLPAPCLVIQGRQDQIAPPEEIEEWAGRTPGARLVMLDAGHLPFLHPDFRAAVGS